MSERIIATKVQGSRLFRTWFLVDKGTHWAIVGPLEHDGSRPVLSVGTKAYVERRWRAL